MRGSEGQWYEEIGNGGENYVKMDVWRYIEGQETNSRVDGLFRTLIAGLVDFSLSPQSSPSHGQIKIGASSLIFPQTHITLALDTSSTPPPFPNLSPK